MDDTHAYILMDCEGGYPVWAPGAGGNVPLVTVDLVYSPNQLSGALTLKWSYDLAWKENPQNNLNVFDPLEIKLLDDRWET